MSAAKPPTIVIVDDDLGAAKALKQRIGGAAEVMPKIPEEVTRTDLRKADLIMVDFELHEEGEEPTGLTAPPNGVALSAVLREHIRGISGRQVTGVALYTGQVEKISGTIPDEVRGFAVARLMNLEWVFEKGDEEAHIKAVSLARSLKALPKNWPEDPEEATAHLHRFLGLNTGAAYVATAAEDISACHPPIHELSNASHALAVIRWLAHRILPYPAFLIDRNGLAARLRLDPNQLAEVLAGSSRLKAELDEIAYTGALCELYGEHWWRAGIDDCVFQWSGVAGDLGELASAIDALAGRKLTHLEGDQVPILGPSYRATGLARIEKSVRLGLDDWPVFAEDAWTTREEAAGDEGLRGLVLPADRSLLPK